MATATKNVLTPALMVALGCTKETSIFGRMNALGLTVECSRCGGSGNYSYCPSHGTTCFKCGGHGKQMPRMTQKLVKQAAEMVGNGGLNSYLETARKVSEMKSLSSKLLVTLDPIFKAYSAAFNAEYRVKNGEGVKIPQWLFEINSEAGDLVYHCGKAEGKNSKNVAFFGLTDVQAAFQYARKPLTDAEKAELLARVEAIKVRAEELAKLFEAKSTVASLLGM